MAVSSRIVSFKNEDKDYPSIVLKDAFVFVNLRRDFLKR